MANGQIPTDWEFTMFRLTRARSVWSVQAWDRYGWFTIASGLTLSDANALASRTGHARLMRGE